MVLEQSELGVWEWERVGNASRMENRMMMALNVAPLSLRGRGHI